MTHPVLLVRQLINAFRSASSASLSCEPLSRGHPFSPLIAIKSLFAKINLQLALSLLEGRHRSRQELIILSFLRLAVSSPWSSFSIASCLTTAGSSWKDCTSTPSWWFLSSRKGNSYAGSLSSDGVLVLLSVRITGFFCLWDGIMKQ